VLQLKLINDMMRKIRRATRWFLRNRRSYLNPASEVELFTPGMIHINENLAHLLNGETLQEWLATTDSLQALGLPDALIKRVAHPADLYSGLSVIEAARIANQPVDKLAKVYFAL